MGGELPITEPAPAAITADAQRQLTVALVARDVWVVFLSERRRPHLQSDRPIAMCAIVASKTRLAVHAIPTVGLIALLAVGFVNDAQALEKKAATRFGFVATFHVK